jgi:hypothetical protein
MPATAAVAVAARSCGRRNAGNAPADSRKIRPLASWPAAMPLPHRARATPAAPALPPANPPQTPDPNTKLPAPAAACPTKNSHTPTPLGKIPPPALRHATDTPANPSSHAAPAGKDKVKPLIAGVPRPRFQVNAQLSPRLPNLACGCPQLVSLYLISTLPDVLIGWTTDENRADADCLAAGPHRRKAHRLRDSPRPDPVPLPLAGRAGLKYRISPHREIPPGALRRSPSIAPAPHPYETPQ